MEVTSSPLSRGARAMLIKKESRAQDLMVQTKAKVTFTTSATIALTGMPGGREAARLDVAVRQYQSHPAQNQRGSAGKLDTTDDCDRGV